MLPTVRALVAENPTWGWPELINALGGGAEYVVYQQNLCKKGIRLGPPKLTDVELRRRLPGILESATSIAGILRTFGLSSNNSQNIRIKEAIRELSLDAGHLRRQGYHAGKRIIRNCDKSLESLLVSDSHLRNPTGLKKRLLKTGKLKNECYLCGLGPTWQDQPLTLHLDHVNGVKQDNRLENLRILCPNCDSQTSTYCGKNKSLVRKLDRKKDEEAARQSAPVA